MTTLDAQSGGPSIQLVESGGEVMQSITAEILQQARAVMQEAREHGTISNKKDPSSGEEKIVLETNRGVTTIISTTTGIEMTTTPPNRGEAVWDLMGTNKIDDKGRCFLPARIRNSDNVKQYYLYREMNPNGTPPVVILSTTPIRPKDCLAGPNVIPLDQQGRIQINNFPGSDRIIAEGKLDFHQRGSLIIILPEGTPEPGQEMIDRFCYT